MFCFNRFWFIGQFRLQGEEERGVVVGEGVPKEHCGIARLVAYLSVLCHLIV